MKRIAAGALAVVLGLLGAHRLAAGRARAVDGVTATSMPTSATAPHRDPVLGERLPSVLGPTAIDAELTAVSSRRGGAPWSRQPREGPVRAADPARAITPPAHDPAPRTA